MQATSREHRLVGRASEQRRLQEVVAQVAAGMGAVLLISGDTGIGKTHLAHDALGVASPRGFLILKGKANPFGHDLAYGPIVSALARFLNALDSPHRAKLTSDLPALGQLIEGLDLPVPERLGDPSLEKTRLFESVLRLLDRSARDAPLAFLLDDLQWFDRSSLQLLAYLAKDLPELPILLVGTYRSGNEAELSGDLSRVLRTLRQARVTVEFELTALPDTEMGELVTSFLGARSPPIVVDWVVKQAAGIPLFAEALVDALLDQGSLEREGDRWVLVGPLRATAPPVVRDAVRDRLDRLGEPERGLVELISVAGGETPFSVLEAVAGPSDLDGALSRLIHVGLIVERIREEVLYDSAHPLTAQVAYEELAGPRRRQLHALLAAAWEQWAPGDLDRLAFHYRSALPDTDPVRATEVSLKAGERALDRFANAEALEHLEAALALAASRSDAYVEQILVHLGETRYRNGDISGAVEAWDEALTRVSDPDSGATTAQLHVLAARALGEMDYEASDRRVETGLAILTEREPSDDLVELLYVGVVAAHRMGKVDLAERRVRMIEEAAESVATDRARAVLAAAEVTILLDRGDYEGARRILDAGSDSFRHGGPLIEIRGHTSAAVVASAWGDLAGLREANRRAMEVVRRFGVPSGEIRVQLGAFLEAFYTGDWERARETVQETSLVADRIHHSGGRFLSGLLGGVLSAFQGDFAVAEGWLAEARSAVESGQSLPLPMDLISTLSALVALERGKAARALAELGTGGLITGPLPPWGPAVRGEAQAKGGWPLEAIETANQLRRLGPDGSYPDAMGSRLWGLATEALGDPDEAVRRLSYATATFDKLGLVFEAARAGIEAAETALRAGDTGRAQSDELALWHQVASRVGAERYVGRARRLLHALGATLPAEGGERELTPRQLEVAVMVAEGLPNAEIAEQLFISVRTVHSHLDHIYTRLGLGSRAALAAWLTRRNQAST